MPLFFPPRKSSRSGAEFRLAAPKILRLGKNTSELAFFSRLIRILALPKILPLGNVQIKFDIALAYSYL